ncbi:MAG: CPBP family intramembrane metalloprotease [Flavobacterium sp.]|nr:MAG: CPBP family intramembrane metalloprotease [Flavobacterium sp.]
MNLKLRSYYGNHHFNIGWPAFVALLLLFLANIGFYIFYLHDFKAVADFVKYTDGYITPGIINNVYSIALFYFLFAFFRTHDAKPRLFRNNTVSAVLVLLISGSGFFILSPFYEKEDLLIVPAGVDFVDLFLSSVFEELFFRVFILGMFVHLLSAFPIRQRLWLSILGTALVFTVAHVFSTYRNGSINLFTYSSLLIFSVGMSWIYIKYSNLILVVYLHFLANFTLNYLPLKSPGYGAGYLFLIFTLVLLAGQGNRVKRYLLEFIRDRKDNIRQLKNVKMSS